MTVSLFNTGKIRDRAVDVGREGLFTLFTGEQRFKRAGNSRRPGQRNCFAIFYFYCDIRHVPAIKKDRMLQKNKG